MSNYPSYESDKIELYEYPNPILNIFDKKSEGWVAIRTPEDAKAVIDSLVGFLLVCIPEGEYK